MVRAENTAQHILYSGTWDVYKLRGLSVLWGVWKFLIFSFLSSPKKVFALLASAFIKTNGLGKAFGPIINTSPRRSHLGLRPDRPVLTMASHIRANVSQQISIHTNFSPHMSHLITTLPQALLDVQFLTGYMDDNISIVTIITIALSTICSHYIVYL